MRISDLSSDTDINKLKALLAAGVITPDQLDQSTISGSFGPSVPVQGTQNALSSALNPGPQDGQDFVRNEDTGQTINLPSQSTQAQGPNPSAAYTGPKMMPDAAQGKMRVVGASGSGQVVDLGSEPARAVPLDYSRPQIDVPGVGRATYGRDGNAYVAGPDGMTKVLLGYDMQGSMALNKYNLDQQKTQAEIAHTQEATRASQANNPNFGTMGGIGGPAPSLDQLDPGTAATVKAMLEGRMQPPGQMALRNPRVLQLINAANQIDPTFDATTWTERYRTAQDFSPAGKSGQVVQAINQALHHAGTVSDAINALNNTNIAPALVNPVVNLFEQKIGGDVRQGNFATAANALSEELKKIYAGGGGSLTELQNWQKSFDPNAGQNQQRSYLATGMQLLQGALQSRKESYERGMGPKANFGNLVSPQAQATLDQLATSGIGASPQGAPQSGGPSIPPAAVAYLKQNPGMRTAFDMKYGQGASASVLGR